MPTFKLVTQWDTGNHTPMGGGTYNLIYEKLEFFARTHYNEYVPCVGPESPRFLARLSDWIGNVSNEDDKRLMFEFVTRLLFFGSGEFVKLHETAFRGPITRWMIDQLNLAFDMPDLEQQLATALNGHTWYCPVTDSMHISDFHHANQLGGVDFRPDFRSLAAFGDDAKVRKFMENHTDGNGAAKPLKYIVLLEDFVGSGSQIEGAIRFAASLSRDIPILFVPEVICPDGDRIARDLVNGFRNVSYEPVIVLDDLLFINETTKLKLPRLDATICDLVKRTYPAVVGNGASDPRPYSQWGFADTGATVVMCSNTPANTLPLIHHVSNTWKALFPRSARIR